MEVYPACRRAARPCAPACSACYEVKCDPGTIKDGYGASLDRIKTCWSPDASVVVMVGHCAAG